MGFVIFLPAYLSEFMYRNYKRAQEAEEFRDKFDSLIKEFAIEKGIFQLNFYPIFLLRRSIYGAILVFLFDSPVAQLILIEITNIFVNI